MKKYLIISCFAWLLFSSCSKYLDIPPQNSITDEQIKELLQSGDDAKIELVLGGLADALPALFRGGGGHAGSDSRYSSFQAQNVMRTLQGNDVCFGLSQPIGVGTIWGLDEYRNGDYTSRNVDKNPMYWLPYWDLITTANKLLFYLTDELVGNNLKMKEYKARALVIRSFAYNYLMETYQDAYMQGGNEKLGLMLYDYYSPTQPYKPRETAVKTYEFIIGDIKEAISLLTDAGKGITSTNTEDIDLAVANFILARAALCTGDWTATITACNTILNVYNTLIPEDAYGSFVEEGPDRFVYGETNAFLNHAVNPEVILGYHRERSNKAHSSWYNAFSNASIQTVLCIDDRLYNAISDDDFRKNAFLDKEYGEYVSLTGTRGVIPAYANFKFSCSHGLEYSELNRNTNNVCDTYMRASEALLMKAEAQAQSGDSNGAKATLNILLAARTKADSPTLTCDNYPAMAGMTALQMVQLQTRIEMWGEKCVEFFNNKRWGIDMDRSTSMNHYDKSKREFKRMTLQIPDNEMINNPLCQQN